MTTPSELAIDQAAQSREYADNALTAIATAVEALTGSIYPATTIDVTFAPVEAPAALLLPDRPASLDDVEAELTWNTDIDDAKPGDLAAVSPDVDIDDFTDTPPVLTFPAEPTLDFGTVPELSFGVRPTIDAIADIDVPDAPSVPAVSEPSLMVLSTPSFGGIDTHDDFLEVLQNLPDTLTLELAAPTAFTYTVGAKYTSSLLTAMKAKLTARMSDGGLSETAEQAQYDRARSREVQIGAANEAEVLRTHEALGFKMPTGALSAQLRQAQVDTLNRISTAARDIAIKQAELAEENIKAAITEGIALEGKLIDESVALERLAFEAAKTLAENAVSIYNALVEKFKAMLSLYQLYAQVYDTLIKSENLKIEEYKGKLQGEQIKADANRTLIEQYKAQIEAGLSLVKIFEAQVGGARARMELEQAKLGAKREEIAAYVAGINGETARLEAYKVGVESQTAKVVAYKTGVEAQVARMQVFDSQVRAYSAKAGAQGERARVLQSYYVAQVQAYGAQWDGFRARVQGEAERFRALQAKFNSSLDGYKADVAKVVAQAEQNERRWAVQEKQYEALQNYTFQAANINNQTLQAQRQSLLDANKTVASVYAQVVGSALSTFHAAASVSGSDSTSHSSSESVGYAYAGNVDADVTPVTSAPGVV